jgi:hypothetical protein
MSTVAVFLEIEEVIVKEICYLDFLCKLSELKFAILWPSLLALSFLRENSK